MRRHLYMIPIKYVGGAALIVFLFGLAFIALRDSLFDEDTVQSVLIQAIPFVAFFVTILLLFIMSIALVAIRYHKTIPHRTHRLIELTLVVGILVSVFAMFQPWDIVGYHYGFFLLLFSLFAFILWSHVTPRSADDDAKLPEFTRRENILAAIAGGIVVVIIAGIFIASAQPQEPYGMRQRQYDFLDEDAQAEIAAQAQQNFLVIQIPFFIFISLFPGLIMFFGVREALAPDDKRKDVPEQMVLAAEG